MSRQLFEMSRQSSVVFLGILLNICLDRVSIVATLFLLIAFSFVATILKLSRHSVLPTLAKSVAFLSLLASFALNPCKNTNLGEDSIILH